MSNRSRLSSKRVSKASKQPGLLESFKRSDKKTSVVEEEEPTVIDLDDDDPYKFVDSQSLLPHSDGWTGAAITGLDDNDDFIMISSSKLTSAPSAKGVATPKQSRPLGRATGSAKRKQTPKSKKDSVQQEEWSEEEMKRAIEASIQEKQREDRRQRQKTRESKAEEEEQLLLAHYQSMAATAGKEKMGEWREEHDDGGGREEGEETTSGGQPAAGLHAPSDQEPSVQQRTTLSSPIPVAGLASTGTTQLKSVSIKKLSLKSLQTKKGKKISDTLKEEEEGEVQVITLLEEGEATAASDEALKVNRSSGLVQNGTVSSTIMTVNKVQTSLERFCVEDKTVPGDDFDATPPISEQEEEIKCGDTDGAQTAVSKPLSRPAPTAAASSKKQSVSDKQGERGKGSTKTGLSLKKGRKRLSDSGNSSFQEMPTSSSAQSPASKRPRIEASDVSDPSEPSAIKSSEMTAAARPELITNAKLPADMEVEQEVSQAPPTEPFVGATASDMGSRKASDSRDMGRVTKDTGAKQAVYSLTGTEKSKEIATKGVDFTTNQKEKVNELREKSHKKAKPTATCISTTESAMETEDAAALPSAVRLRHKELPDSEMTLSTTVTDDRDTKNTQFQLKRRMKAVGWPPVKIRPLEIPRNPSLQAPCSILPAEHTKVLIQCFNAYFAKLAAAQRKVLRRIRWGSPVSSFNKVGVNSLASGRRTRRSRASNVPYSEYALDLKIMAHSSRSKSSSPMVSSKRSTPSKSPVSNIRKQFSPSDENGSDSDFEPFKVTSKRSSGKKSNVNAGASKTAVTTPTTRPQRATKSRLCLGKRSPQVQERVNKSLSPSVQFEREESPDILPPAAHTHRQGGEPEQELSTKPSGRRLEFGIAAAKPTLSVSPQAPTATTSQSRKSPSPQFQEDNDNVMLDLTSPSPPLLSAQPQGPRTVIDRDSVKDDDFATNFDDAEDENLVREKPAFSHVRVSHDITDDSDEEGHLRQAATSAAATTGAKNNSGSWLDSRKPPPTAQKPKPKRQPAKQANNSKASAQSKKAGRGGGARGRRPAKKTTSAALRIKALIQKSGSESESEHNSLEGSEGDSSGKDTTSKRPLGQKSRPKRRQTIDSTDDSEVTDMELEEREKETASPGLLTSRTGQVKRGKEVTRSNQDSHDLEGSSVIDLTTESQLPQDHTSSSSPSPRIQSPEDDGCIPCPMCNKRFDSSVIQLHAEQCDGPDSDNDHQWSESITRCTTSTTASVGKPGAGAGGKKGSLSTGKRQLQQGEPRERGRGRGGRRKSYQPSLVQLVNKEREVRGEEDIDSDTTAEDDPLDPDVNLDDLSTSNRRGTDPTSSYYADTNLEWTERDEQQQSTTAVSTCHGAYGGAFDQQPEDGEGGFIVESSPGSTPQPEAIPIEGGGYIIDPSMISSSPIKCKLLSDLDPQERASYKDQYKRKSGRGEGQGRKIQRGGGRRQLTNEERESATWGRDDFGDLFNTDERSKGQGRRGRGRGRWKYDWIRAHRGRGRGRGRPGSRGRGRRS